ncbi:proteasome assembly chaperone family protein [Candidatus Woesearchaeota archaeon]|nr:proteasome assembly chaperone family protein [Candidatus Woesearchaeota archaeon]
MHKLRKTPKKPIVITGFPGFGLVGTIATEFLIEHLKTESIGKIWLEDAPAIVAVHNQTLVDPIGVFYDEKHNIVIIHGIAAGQGSEWQLAEEIVKIADAFDAYEVIALEGVGTAQPSINPKIFYFSQHDDKKAKFSALGFEAMNEGIILGVTSALMVKLDKPLSSLFVESHADMPDSHAAASLVGALNKLLGLGVDEAPLIESAKVFERKLKGLLEKSKVAQEQKEKKMMSYVG